MRYIPLLLLTLTVGCVSKSPWQLESIASGEKQFDSARLSCCNTDSLSPLRLEFLRLDTNVELYLSSMQYPFRSDTPDRKSVLVKFAIEGEPSFEQRLPLREGRMRLHIPATAQEKIAAALSDGKEITVHVDDLHETFRPDYFSYLYDQFNSSAPLIRNPFKGPLE